MKKKSEMTPEELKAHKSMLNKRAYEKRKEKNKGKPKKTRSSKLMSDEIVHHPWVTCWFDPEE